MGYNLSMLYLTRKYDFCASHRLFQPELSDEENWEIYRECSRVNGHGHNYEMEIRVKGLPDMETGMLIDMVALDTIVKETIINKVDHYHLNFDVPFMQGCVPTAENMAIRFWEQLADQFPEKNFPNKVMLDTVKIIETRNNIAEYRGQ